MGRYLAISSQVAHGHVGLSAIVPALQALGHEVIALPTILLSNHPGHAKVAGTPIEPAVLARMLDALEANGRLAPLDAVLTGYLPTTAHVDFAAAAVRRVRKANPGRDCRYFCDPVLGDDPKGLYVAVEVAQAIKDLLLPLADTVSPNRFELAWLSGNAVDDAAGVLAAAPSLHPARRICATSIPGPGGTLLTLDVSIGADGAVTGGASCSVARRASVPHGTGDLLSALLLTPMSLGQAVACVDAVIDASRGCDELQLSRAVADWTIAAPIEATPLLSAASPG